MIIATLFGITELIGRFHPLLVHLPVGILLIASLFYFLSAREKYTSLKPAVTISLFWGILSAVASCISGYILSGSDDYDASMISKHQWFGIATAVISFVAYYLAKKNNKQLKWIMLLMILLIIITGHLGGSITHGSDYLTKAFFGSGGNKEIIRKPIADIQNAAVYSDIIKPVLEARCYSCHGASKQKGKLRLDEPEYILKGGEDGKVIIAGKPGESDLIERLLLPKDDDDHMPPKEKPQLSKQDIELLHWWISNGADFNKKVNEFAQPENVKPLLLALQTGKTFNESSVSDVPAKEVSKGDEKIIAQLKARGAAVSPVAANSNYLSVNFVAVDSITQSDLNLLQSIQKQLVWLRLGFTKIRDNDLAAVAKLNSLTRLYLERTNITDNGLEHLSMSKQLQYLNLSGTKITVAGLEKLKELKNLKQVYLYQTSVTANEWAKLKQIFNDAMIDTGGYTVPILISDTTELMEAIKRN